MPSSVFKLRFSLPFAQTGILSANAEDKYISKKPSLKMRICPADMTCISVGIQVAGMILKISFKAKGRD